MGKQAYEVKNINIPIRATLEQYKKGKIKILQRDFLIKLTDEEKAHINSLPTEYAVDTACRKIIYDRLGKY